MDSALRSLRPRPPLPPDVTTPRPSARLSQCRGQAVLANARAPSTRTPTCDMLAFEHVSMSECNAVRLFLQVSSHSSFLGQSLVSSQYPGLQRVLTR